MIGVGLVGEDQGKCLKYSSWNGSTILVVTEISQLLDAITYTDIHTPQRNNIRFLILFLWQQHEADILVFLLKDLKFWI